MRMLADLELSAWRAIPTAVLFTGGNERERRMGVQPASSLEAAITAARLRDRSKRLS